MTYKWHKLFKVYLGNKGQTPTKYVFENPSFILQNHERLSFVSAQENRNC